MLKAISNQRINDMYPKIENTCCHPAQFQALMSSADLIGQAKLKGFKSNVCVIFHKVETDSPHSQAVWDTVVTSWEEIQIVSVTHNVFKLRFFSSNFTPRIGSERSSPRISRSSKAQLLRVWSRALEDPRISTPAKPS